MTSILAYGSLMWDNALATYPGEAVRVDGFRRAFVGENTTRWGSPEHPCPQIGLVPGDGCDAVLFDLPRGESRLILRNLGRREGAKARTIQCGKNGRRVRAKSFLPAPGARAWEDGESLVRALLAAKGSVGTGAEYVRTLVHAMGLWKIDDPLVREIWKDVRI
jgi:cation transport regulator ChaC